MLRSAHQVTINIESDRFCRDTVSALILSLPETGSKYTCLLLLCFSFFLITWYIISINPLICWICVALINFIEIYNVFVIFDVYPWNYRLGILCKKNLQIFLIFFTKFYLQNKNCRGCSLPPYKVYSV